MHFFLHTRLTLSSRSTFLNVLNEKQWTTNCAAIVQQLNQKDLGLLDPL